MHSGEMKRIRRYGMVVSRRERVFVFPPRFSFYGRRKDIILLPACQEICRHVH
jgi:hypothetical protein